MEPVYWSPLGANQLAAIKRWLVDFTVFFCMQRPMATIPIATGEARISRQSSVFPTTHLDSAATVIPIQTSKKQSSSATEATMSQLVATTATSSSGNELAGISCGSLEEIVQS